ncbi:MAG: hypothetical protein OXI41_12060 [Chloroflexota bacterium]|nr:hypothetical protein [Chloroflexota bacterium]MDE2896469.1 hypothetical protein [Chloroflexota bacterium]
MTTPRLERYEDLSSEYLRRARAYLSEGDLTQASEKGWGAAAVSVKAVATTRGLNHASHYQLRQVVQELAREADDDEMRTYFGNANDLHMNFYEGWLDNETVALYLAHVERFIEKLNALS